MLCIGSLSNTIEFPLCSDYVFKKFSNLMSPLPFLFCFFKEKRKDLVYLNSREKNRAALVFSSSIASLPNKEKPTVLLFFAKQETTVGGQLPLSTILDNCRGPFNIFKEKKSFCRALVVSLLVSFLTN